MASDKKIALITGANKGFGFEMARQLGKAGTTVVLGARDAQKGEAAAEWLQKKFGRLDVLINNAEISAEDLGSGTTS